MRKGSGGGPDLFVRLGCAGAYPPRRILSLDASRCGRGWEQAEDLLRPGLTVPPAEWISESRARGWDLRTHQDVQLVCVLCRHCCLLLGGVWGSELGVSPSADGGREESREGRAVAGERGGDLGMQRKLLATVAGFSACSGNHREWVAGDGEPANGLFPKNMARFFTSILSTESITPVPFLVLNQQPPPSASLTVSDNGVQQWTAPSPPPSPPPPPFPHTACRSPPVLVHGCTQPSPSCSPSWPSNNPSTDTKNVICPGPHGLSQLSANSQTL